MRQDVTVKPVLWKVLNAAAAVIAARLAAQALQVGWKAATGGDPPTVPEDPQTSMAEALAWALASGAVMGLARMYATRRAAQYYLKSTGELPKALRRD